MRTANDDNEHGRRCFVVSLCENTIGRHEGCVCVPLFSACAHTHSPTIALLHKFTLRVCRAVIVSVCAFGRNGARNQCVYERTNGNGIRRIGFAAERFLFRRTVSSTKDRAADAKYKIDAQRQANNWIYFRFIFHILVPDVLVLVLVCVVCSVEERIS